MHHPAMSTEYGRVIVRHLPVLAAVVAVLALTACRALAPGSGPPSPEPVASTGASAAPIVTEATPQPSQCFLGDGIADVPYSDLRGFAAFADRVVIGEVVDVGELQYTTESGERPSCEYVQAAQGVFGVGRMIELRVERTVAGTAEAGDTFTYWLPGGSLGGDTSRPHHFGLDAPDVGDRMLGLLVKVPGDIDIGPGVLEVDAYELFAIADDGRIQTPNPSEVVTTETVDVLLDGLLPAP